MRSVWIGPHWDTAVTQKDRGHPDLSSYELGLPFSRAALHGFDNVAFNCPFFPTWEKL